MKSYLGAMYGLAIGDAIGAPIEMSLPGSFDEVQDMRGGGYFKLKPGEWTDDTALALCSATSLVEKQCFDPGDHMVLFLQWYRDGYMSTKKDAFGVGMVTAAALMRFESTREDYCGPTGVATAHNGSLMCLAPLVLTYAHSYENTLYYVSAFSRLTHGAPVAIDTCCYMAHCMINALQGVDKQSIVKDFTSKTDTIKDIIRMVNSKPIITKDNYASAATTLHAALWAFLTTSTFRGGMLRVVNLGWDADTMGAVYGQLAGAFYGIDAIPKEWQDVVFKKELIAELTNKLYLLSKTKDE